MEYRHSFTIHAPLEKVAEFHRSPESMAAITPPPIIVRLHQAPEILTDGEEMDFTLWIGPVPIRWSARIEGVSATGFTDKLIEGPFLQWDHHHSFRAIDANRTLVIDQITAIPKKQWFWGLLGRLMWWNLPILFAYRGWKTRRLLSS